MVEDNVCDVEEVKVAGDVVLDVEIAVVDAVIDVVSVGVMRQEHADDTRDAG